MPFVTTSTTANSLGILTSCGVCGISRPQRIGLRLSTVPSNPYTSGSTIIRFLSSLTANPSLSSPGCVAFVFSRSFKCCSLVLGCWDVCSRKITPAAPWLACHPSRSTCGHRFLTTSIGIAGAFRTMASRCLMASISARAWFWRACLSVMCLAHSWRRSGHYDVC
jgi:hypothetical protein